MKRLMKSLAAIVSMTCACAAHAEWPEKPVKMVVPYAPGGAADAVARVVATELGARLKQQVIVENKPGAGGTIGAQAVAQAPADGYTFLYDATSFTVNPSLFPKLRFDYLKDFAAVGMVARIPTLLVVPSNSPINSVADLVQRARATPDRITYASAGNGSAAHLSAALFGQGFNVGLVHVPYKGGAPALTDLAGGQVDLMFSAVTASGPLIKSGKLKAIATAFDQRVDAFPQVPTVAESGLPGFRAYEWNAIWAPTGTPPAIRNRMEAELRSALSQPAMRQRFAEMGALPATGSAKDLTEFVKAETAKWASVIKTADIKLD
ncbi:tripartite tricarboxylate transporter substrate binding protein [Caldimonas tepidiphila]|uniref:tripartite tricarboxylate transporter substrate binding protein n=1 Tax=Caldimonas tepidiphila TaxID=2315841 RepID=UPI001F0CAD9E|nr:tripartite tricarboxylate transporter substrate binding protein [Caldimonas tepidiphila]